MVEKERGKDDGAARGDMSAKGKEKTIVLNTRDLVLLFIFFVVVLMIVFTIGLMVGRNFAEKPAPDLQAKGGTPVTESMEPVTSSLSTLTTSPNPMPPATEDIGVTQTAQGVEPSPVVTDTAKPTAAEEKAPPPPEETAPRKGFIVQVKAVTFEADAKKEAAQLRKKGFPGADFIRSGNPKFPFKIIVGRADSVEAARKLLEKAKKSFPDAFTDPKLPR